MQPPLRERLLARSDQLELSVTTAAEGPPIPPPDLLSMFGATAEQVKKLTTATHACVASDFSSDGVALWNVLALAHALLDKAVDGVCFDPLRLSLKKPPEVNGQLRIAQHIIVPFSVEAEGLGWMTTKGLCKFGLPELELTDVPPALANDLIDVVNGLAGYLQRLAASTPGSELVLEDELRLPLGELLESLAGKPGDSPSSTSTLLGLTYNPSDEEDGADFLSVHPPGDVEQVPETWYYQMLGDLWGRKETMVNVEGDLLVQAHKRALDELPVLKSRFQAGLEPGEIAMVKYGFPYGDEDRLEFMWVTLESWRGESLVGLLSNHPVHCTELCAGARVEIPEEGIFDWTLHGADGKWIGGYTDSIVREWMPSE